MRKKKVLYYSVHEILEYDDLRLLTGAGYDVYSIGSFGHPAVTANRFRSAASTFVNQDDFEAAAAGGVSRTAEGALVLRRSFVERFDVTVFNHDAYELVRQFDALSCRPIIYRTIGQARLFLEQHLAPYADRIITCRYDAREEKPGFLRTDAVIRFGKYPGDFPEWTGEEGFVLTFMNSAKRDEARPTHDDYKRILAGSDARLYGMWNEGLEHAQGLCAPDEQMRLYQGCRAYLYVHSLTACYTLNFMEAMITGVPIVAPSAAMTADPPYPDWDPACYSVEEILSGGAGFVYGSVQEARDILSGLPSTDLSVVSRAARARARELFGAPVIERQWRDLIEKHT